MRTFRDFGRPRPLVRHFGIDPVPDLPARYNVAPTQPVAYVGDRGRGRKLSMLRWRLIPSWAPATAGKTALCNARAETVASKASFREPFRQRRCLIPATGFYEWLRDGKRKVPHLFTVPGERVFAFAGLWDVWQGRAACAIITTAANELVAPIHDRMPVIVSSELEQRASRLTVLPVRRRLPVGRRGRPCRRR